MQEAKLRGPHPFPLERLLNICWALLDADAAASDEAPPLDGVERQSAEAFMQISSLVSLQLLSQARQLLPDPAVPEQQHTHCAVRCHMCQYLSSHMTTRQCSTAVDEQHVHAGGRCLET